MLLTNGATIQVTGVESGGEAARFDFISFTPMSAQLPTLSIAAGSNGDEAGPVNGSFTVSLSQAVTVATTVSYTVSGTATAGSDYTALSGSVTIPAGQTSATITVPVIDDTLIDPDETVTVTLAAPSGDVVLGTSTASIQIADNEVANFVNLAATTQAGEPATNGAFTVSLETAAATDTVISYSVAGSATGGSDYAALSGTVTIPAGNTSAVIPVSVINDFAVEGPEDVIVTLTGATGDANIALGTTIGATITISDDDVPVVPITIQAEAIASLPGGSVSAYRVENDTDASGGSMLSLLGGPANETGTASFTFSGVTALYKVEIGAFDENDGAPAASLAVAQNGTSIGTVVLDQDPGGNAASPDTKVTRLVNSEVLLTNGATIQVTGVESGGEAARFDFISFTPMSAQLPTLSIAAGSNGDEAGPVNGSFTVSLSQAVTVATTVSYTVSGTATAGSDYTALSGSVTIPAGQTSATITVPVIDDTLIDPDETVTVTLAAPSGDVVLGTSTASIQIADNEVANFVNLAATTQAGEPATNGAFTVSLETAAATDTVISYSVAGSATGGSDYAALSGTVTIPAGNTSAVIPVSVINDFAVEGPEDVIVTLTGATGDANIALGTMIGATITISDDDVPVAPITIQAEAIASLPGGSVSAYRVENDTDASGGSMLSLLGGAANETGTASFTFSGATALYKVEIGAFDENDGAPAASLAVAQNGTSIGTVLLDQDPGGNAASPNTKVTRLVNNEVLLTNGATIQVTGVESGGEAARFDFISFTPMSAQLPTLSIAAGSNGAEAGPVNGSFTVSLSQAVTVATTVSYTVSGTATAGSDYTALSGSVTIPAGQTSATITVPVIDDLLIDPDETVTVTLAAPSGGVVLGSTNSATIAISDDELPLANGAAKLEINVNADFIQQSNFGSNSFQITNTGEKTISKVVIDVTDALYPDTVFDPFGLAGDSTSKVLQIDTNGGTGIIDPDNGSQASPGSAYIGAGGIAGYEGIQLLFDEAVNGGFQPGEIVGFSVDMDPNSIAGSSKDYSRLWC